MSQTRLSHISGILLILVTPFRMVIKLIKCAISVTSLFNEKLMSNECMLSSEDSVLKFKAKRIISEFQYVTS